MARDLVKTIQKTVFTGTDVFCYARLKIIDSSHNVVNATRAAIASIAYEITNDVGTIVSSGALTVASVIFDTLQTGTVWTTEVDSTGYNFVTKFANTIFTTDSTQYKIEISFTITGSEDIAKIQFEPFTEG